MSRVKYAFMIFSILISNKCFAEQKKTKFGVEPFNTPQTKPKKIWDLFIKRSFFDNFLPFMCKLNKDCVEKSFDQHSVRCAIS